MAPGRRWSGLLVACALGCETSPAAPAESTSGADGNATSGSSGTSEGTTFGGPSACTASGDCEAGYCVAPYDPGGGSGSAGMGMAACVPECVPEDALDRWCIDDASCCEGLSCDHRDGFCVGPSSTSEGTIGASWSTGDDTSSDGGETSSSSGGESSSTG